MKFTFYKYQGTGNDFVIIDNRTNFFPKDDIALVAKICHRKFGVGADGLLLLEENSKVDFTMVYYNADGNLGSMCGNGGRCMVHFANFLGIIDDKTIFEAVDGLHEATIKEGIVSLKMNDVAEIKTTSDYIFLDTGSPHHVALVSDLETYNVEKEGAFIRNNTYGKEGSNINFVEPISETIFAVRTYERGVEAETLSCGTGVTAVAIALFETNKISSNKITLRTQGGDLKVSFNKTKKGYENVYLIGPATQVFKGVWK
ncbi:MAG: diaminopimelate epimerase [Flavobacteriaceae bacterium]|nr:diaminopimelate epimerase [Flavobacteriaceae bacterium]